MLLRVLILVLSAVGAGFVAAWIIGEKSDARPARIQQSDRPEIPVPGPGQDANDIDASGNVVFADGSRGTVTWRDREQMNDFDPPYALAYERLLIRAKTGDAEAAYGLYEILGNACRDALESEQELVDSIELIYQAHTVPAPGHDRLARINNPDNVKDTVAAMAASYQSCLGITAEQKNDAEMWLELAAMNGHSLARLHYGSRHSVAELAIRQLEFAWRDGEAAALELLHDRYRQRVDAGGDQSERLRSYAALYAFAALEAASIADRNTASPSRTKSRLDAAAATLTAEELDEAGEMGRNLVTDNPLCCYRL